jgi:hypothetical protein
MGLAYASAGEFPRLMRDMKRILVLLSLSITTATAIAQDLDLLVQHRIKVVGMDGITRTTEFSERVVRRKDQVWIERVLPGAVSARQHEHESAKGTHKHFNVAGAARWVSLGPDKQPRLTLVDAGDELMIDVDRPDYGNVGFDGSWEGAYFLLNPQVLSTMTQRGPRLPDGAQWYERRRAGGSVKVLWDEALKYPREVESVSGDGLETRSMRATTVSGGNNLPWEATRRFDRKGYNDLLD